MFGYFGPLGIELQDHPERAQALAIHFATFEDAVPTDAPLGVGGFSQDLWLIEPGPRHNGSNSTLLRTTSNAK